MSNSRSHEKGKAFTLFNYLSQEVRVNMMSGGVQVNDFKPTFYRICQILQSFQKLPFFFYLFTIANEKKSQLEKVS